ncbi:interaptin isoform X1 [Astyanax mexicanus]|uniref:interaptin isoform X1 n=1 Tax=Astyanax mexicanus TaxID=7994 RepID=UPI0020CB2181|nr:interaptin isoform X1 [Astyanax mexicanus]
MVSPMADWDWDCGLNPRGCRNSFRSLSPFSLSEFDLWEKSLLKTRSSAWSCMGLSGSGHRSKISTSSLGSQCGVKQSESAGLKRWRSASRLAPEGAPPACSSQGVELRVALEESSMRRAELIRRLRLAQGSLDTQTDLLKAKESQLQHSQSTTQMLELKQKQLAKALSALEEEKDAVELSRYKESRCRAELQEKVLRLEMDLFRMKSSLDMKNSDETSASHPNSQLNRTMPVTKDDFIKEGQNQTETEMKKLKKALREAEERTETLEAERNHAVKQLYSSKEGHRKALNQIEELKQKLGKSLQVQSELQEQLSDARSRLGQLELEKDLLSTKTLRLEDGLEDLKAKLSAALADKDRLVQEKADLHQKTQSLKLQLQRAQLGREGFTEQVCELHSELTQAKSQASRQQQNTLLMKEELQSINEVNEKLTADLAAATERLQETFKKLHELEAERLIHTNQITALETERLQLIGEKEEMVDVFDQGNQEELRELREKCYHLRDLQITLEQENQDLRAQCQGLEKKVQNMEAEYGCKEEELLRVEMELEEEKEEQKKVAAHWNERWLDISLALQSTQAELEETKKHHEEKDTVREDMAAELASMVETLETQLKNGQDQIQSLLEQKTQLETEMSRVKKEAGALERVELDACRQQLELEQSRRQSLQQRLLGNPVSLEEMELVQVMAELQKMWDMLKSRDTELEEQQQELQSARGQVTQQSSEVQRLEQQLSEREQELKERDLILKSIMSQQDKEKKETQMKLTALEKELAGLKALKTEQSLNTVQKDPQTSESLKAKLEVTKNEGTAERPHTTKPPQQDKEQKGSPSVTRKEKSVSINNIDPDHQRRLITEQLKILFKEREQLGDKASTALQKRPTSVIDLSPKSKSMKNVETLSSEGKNQQEEHRQAVSVQQGAEENNSDSQERAHSEQMTSEEGPQVQQMSAQRVEMEELKDTNENRLKATLKLQRKFQDVRLIKTSDEAPTIVPCVPGFLNNEEEKLQMRPPLLCIEGTFTARQVEVCDSGMEDEEEGTK